MGLGLGLGLGLGWGFGLGLEEERCLSTDAGSRSCVRRKVASHSASFDSTCA